MDTFSLIIPSSGREDSIRKVLGSWGLSSGRIREILVVWDGCSCRKIEAEFSSCRYAGPLGGKGPAAARNAGASLATGDWLLFLDDDVMPCAGAFGEIEKLIREFPETGAWAFSVSAHPSVSSNIYVKWAYMNRAHSVYSFSPEPVSHARFCSSFILIRRSVFEELNGFNENLRFFEDVEFAFRAQRAGVLLCGAGSVSGLHLKQMDRQWFADRCQRLGPGLLALHNECPEAVSSRVAFMINHRCLCRVVSCLCSRWMWLLPVIERIPGLPGIALLDFAGLGGMTGSLSRALSRKRRSIQHIA